MKTQLVNADSIVCQQLHHLRNDLLAVTLYSSTLVSEENEEDGNEEPATKILQAARQMRQRLDELTLVLSPTESAAVIISPDREVSKLLTSEEFTQRTETPLISSLSGGDSQILLPRKAMKAILTHLIKNVHLRINLTTGIADERWFLKVSDNGPGSSISSDTDLTLVTFLAESHQGKIALDPQDSGSTITVSFPLYRGSESK